MISSLHRKLLRDLWQMRGQALAIAMVLGAGVATTLMSVTTLHSLRNTRDAYYQDYAFAEIFASLKRAPLTLSERIQTIPGVNRTQLRVKAAATLEVAGFDEPVQGELVSYQPENKRSLNRLYLREGRHIAPGRDDEVVISEGFAEAHGFRPGDVLSVIVNGRKRQLSIVGIGMSPEYIYQFAPGAIFPDFKRYGILWMDREALATAYGMQGAFNHVALTLRPGANPEDVKFRLDRLLAPYGGLKSQTRARQPSHEFLNEEFRQLESMSVIYATIFLGVSAFLLNISVNRLVRTQREQIAVLKAFGYGNRAVAWHYLELVACILAIGLAIGTVAGLWLAGNLTQLYGEYYRFPFLRHSVDPASMVTVGFIAVGAALSGTLFAVRRAARMPPAEAMRPEPPHRYRVSPVERWGLGRWLDQPTRMILRQLFRHPFKTFLSTLGISLACAIMMAGTFFRGSLDEMVNLQFNKAQREDMLVSFVEPVSTSVISEVRNLPGVRHLEPFRAVPVNLVAAQREYRTGIQGYIAEPELHRALRADETPIRFDGETLVITEFLADKLQVTTGDRLRVEVLTGRLQHVDVTVGQIVKQYMGIGAYMNIDALNRLLGEGAAYNGVFLSIDDRQLNTIYDRLKERPAVLNVDITRNLISAFYDTFAEQVLIMVFFISILSGIITFGVVYNSARISLAERSRELASLRVLGFTRGEVSTILLGELGLLTLLSLPLGFALGTGLCWYFTVSIQLDLFRMPLVIEPDTLALAATVVVVSSVVSGLIVRRKLDHLDMIEVLKTKE